MTDYSEYKIPIFPGINDQPIAPTDTEGLNISYVCQQFNNFVDMVQLDVEDLNSTNRLLQEEINSLSSNSTLNFTFDILDGAYFFIGEIPSGDYIARAIISGVPDPSAITFSVAGNNFAVDTVNDLEGSFELIFSGSNPDVYATDILEGISTDFPYIGVTIELFVEQY